MSPAAQPAARPPASPVRGLGEVWERWTAGIRGDSSTASRIAVIGGIAVLGAFAGAVVAVAGLNGLFLCGGVIGCAFILRDFRIGVVLLILLMPISNSYVFPHAMLGITGLNPLNLLLAATLGAYLLQGLFDGSLRRFVPHPLLWLYLVPFVIAGALGSQHVGDIAPGFFLYDLLNFHSAFGYLRDLVIKPLLLVVFALLVAAAVAKSEKPEKFLIPTMISIWMMGSMAIVYVFLTGVSLDKLSATAGRMTELGIHANELGRLYAVAYALLLFTWAQSREPGLRLALLASMGMLMVALMLTFSRGAFVGFMVVNALFLLWRLDARTVIFVGLLATAALFLLPDAVYDRLTTGFGSGADAISAGRIERIWLPLLPEILRSPIYGNGLGSILWSEAMRVGGGTYILAVQHPHNAYLEAVLDMGIVGLVLLCAYFAHVWKAFRALSIDPSLSPALRGFYLGAAAGLLSFLLAGIAGSSLTPVPAQSFLWLAIGMMYGERARRSAP